MKNTDKSSEKIELQVQARTEVGKKTNYLRKQGIIPANIYGPEFKSQTISVTLKDFTPVYKVARETGIIYLKLGSESIPTLVKFIQRDPVSNDILHIDFRKVNLRQKMETEVPVEVVGESTAVTQLAGVLLVQSGHVMVEALPQNIPQNIQVDISVITELGQEIKVKDLPTSTDYEIKEDPEKVIVSVVEHKEESLEAETTVEAPEITTGAQEAAEGEEGAEGAEAAPAEEKKEEK
jgi:large subunit ribosomal protein L25